MTRLDDQSFLEESEILNQICQNAANLIESKIANSPASEYEKRFSIAISVPHTFRNEPIPFGHFNGFENFYPASVVKLFFLVYCAHVMENLGIPYTLEFARAITDMIVDSNNDATALVVDQMTQTTGGQELFGMELESWLSQRRKITQFFVEHGFSSVETSQKTWNEGPYGRELQCRGKNGEFRNRVSPFDVVKLLTLLECNLIDEVANRKNWIFNILMRDLDNINDSQVNDFIGRAIVDAPELVKDFAVDGYYSKAGWTEEVRHDVALVRLSNPMKRKVICLSVFTQGVSNDFSILPGIATSIISELVDSF